MAHLPSGLATAGIPRASAVSAAGSECTVATRARRRLDAHPARPAAVAAGGAGGARAVRASLRARDVGLPAATRGASGDDGGRARAAGARTPSALPRVVRLSPPRLGSRRARAAPAGRRHVIPDGADAGGQSGQPDRGGAGDGGAGGARVDRRPPPLRRPGGDQPLRGDDPRARRPPLCI